MAAQVISFRCTLKNKLGHVLSQTINRDVLSSESHAPERLPILSSALRGLRKGEMRTVNVGAKDAYGYYDLSLVVTRLREELVDGETLKLGETVKYVRDGALKSYRVVEVSPLAVTLDGNHPFAGQDLVFEIEALEAREAAPEEQGIESAVPGLRIFH